MPYVGKHNKVVYTHEDIQFIRDNYETMTNKEMAYALGVGLTRLRMELYAMGLKRMELEYWTDEQIDFLKANFRQIGDIELAAYFNATWPKKKGWTHKHMEKKRKYLNLKRTPLEIVNIRERNIKNGMFRICPVKRWDTTGRAPIGEKRVWLHNDRNFVVIKTETGWRHFNRWLWEQHHGKLKPNQYVVPKNGNQLFCELEDLEVIDRAEHAYRNRTRYNRYPDELKNAIKIKNKLLKIIDDEQQ